MKIFILLFFAILNNSFASDWKVAATFDEGSVFDIICYDSINCYALHKKPLGPEIHKTTDAGKSWNMIYTSNFLEEGPPFDVINADRLYIADSNNLYITYTENVAVFKQSTDGGKTFKKTKISDMTFLSWLTNFCMLDNNVGIAINDTNAYFTHDNWKTVEYKTDLIFRASIPKYQNYDKDNIIFLTRIGNGDEIIKYNLKTHQKELIFKFQSRSIDPSYKSGFKYINDTLAIIVGSQGNGVGDQSKDIIFKTNGSLKDWIKVIDKEVSPIFGLEGVDFYDTKNGVATGQSGKILTTKDGGNTWNYEIPKEIYVGGDKLYGPFTMRVEWAGKTPLFGTFGGSIYRYEGDFFDFSEPKLVLDKPTIMNENCNQFVIREFKLQSWQVDLNWNAVKSAKKYEIEISEDNNFKIKYFSLNTISSNSVVIPNIIDFDQDKIYYWKVRAINDNIYSDWSDFCQFTTTIDYTKPLEPICGDSVITNNVVIRWNKVSNATKYMIEISNNEDFIEIIKQDSSNTSEYNFNIPKDTTYYWRIKTVGENSVSNWSNLFDNCYFIKSTPSSIENDFSISNNIIFPNPVKDELTLDIKNIEIRDFSCEILDITGQQVYTGKLNNTFSIDVSNLPTGTYFLNFNFQSYKFIKE